MFFEKLKDFKALAFQNSGPRRPIRSVYRGSVPAEPRAVSKKRNRTYASASNGSAALDINADGGLMLNAATLNRNMVARDPLGFEELLVRRLHDVIDGPAIFKLGHSTRERHFVTGVAVQLF